MWQDFVELFNAVINYHILRVFEWHVTVSFTASYSDHACTVTSCHRRISA